MAARQIKPCDRSGLHGHGHRCTTYCTGSEPVNWAREFRKFRGRRFTQRQLALALGITRRAVIYIEQGEREPRIRTVEKFKLLREKHAAGTAKNPSRKLSMWLRTAD